MVTHNSIQSRSLSLRGQGERLLLVEDDELLRKAAAKLLTLHNYQVVAAASGEEALKLWCARAQPFAMLITDVVMPGEIDGCKLAAQLRQDDSALRVIVLSGNHQKLAGQRLPLSPGMAFLHKPFAMADLLLTIQRCFGQAVGAAGPQSA